MQPSCPWCVQGFPHGAVHGAIYVCSSRDLTMCVWYAPALVATASMLESLSRLVEALEPSMLSQEQVAAAFKELETVLIAAEKRRSHRAKRVQVSEQ